MRNCLSADGHLVVSSKRQNNLTLEESLLSYFLTIEDR